MKGAPQPPAVAAWLVGRSVSPAERNGLLGDLAEQFHRRQQQNGARAASRWYWTQTAGLVVALVPRRATRGVLRTIAPGTGRAAVRSLIRSPGTSAASCVILAIGIAAPIAMFALEQGAIRSLPGDPTDRIVQVSRLDPDGRVIMALPWELYEGWSAAAEPMSALTGLAAYNSPGTVAVGDGQSPAGRVWAAYAVPELFALLDVSPRLGRLYSDLEEGGLPASLIREDLWEKRFDGDPGVLGRTLRIDGVDHKIVGVLPRDFGFPADQQVWMQPRSHADRSWLVVGRLAPDAEPAMAQEQLGVATASLPREVQAEGTPEAVRLRVERYTTAYLTYDSGDELARRVGVLMLVLLLLTALNVTAVMLARGIARARETSIRIALGASRAQVLALTAAESALLCVTAGALGLVLGHFALEAMTRYLLSQVTIEPYWVRFGLDATSLGQTAGLVLVASVLSGVVPGLHAIRTRRGVTLRASPGITSRRTLRALTLLVGTQATLSCFLLTLASQAVAEARIELQYGHDFPTDGVLTALVALEPPRYPDQDARASFVAEVVPSLRADPAVVSATWASAIPGKDGHVRPATVTSSTGESDPSPVQVRSVDPEFLSTFQARRLTGRAFTSADAASSDQVVIINEAFARRHGIGSDAVGQTVALGQRTGEGAVPHAARIVGVVDDRGITPNRRGRAVPGVYVPMPQALPPAGYILVRIRDGTPLTDIWHASVRAVDPYLPLGEVLTLDEQLRRGHALPTLYQGVFTALGAAALLMALVGLYGLHAFSLSQRVRELGLRRALGARSRQLAWQSMRRGLRPVLLGTLAGAVPAILLARAILPQELHLSVLAVGPLVLLLSALLAIWGPTSSASRTDPMECLREA